MDSVSTQNLDSMSGVPTPPPATLQVEGQGEKAKVSFNMAEDDDGDFFATSHAFRSPGGTSITQGEVHRSFAANLGDDEPKARDIGIPLQFIIEHMEHYVEANELYRQLAIFLPFLLCFIFWFVAGRDVEPNYYIMKGVRDRLFMTEFPNAAWQLEQFRFQMLNGERLFIELDKDYAGIGNDGDWADWFRDVIITTTFDCQNPDAARDLLLPQGQDYHLGAFRFRTQRMPQFSCKPKEVFYPSNTTLFPRSCYAPHKESKELHGQWCNYSNPMTGEPMFTYKKCSEVPGAPLVALEGVYHCGGFMFEIPFTATCNQALEFHDIAVGKTGDGCPFVDNWGTRLVIVEWFIYTPATDSFHGIKLYSEIPAGGFWIDQFVFHSFVLWSQSPKLILDVVVVLFVLFYWVRFFIDMVSFYREKGRVLAYFFQFWSILEFINLTTFLAMFILRFTWMATCHSANAELSFPFKPTYPAHLDRIMNLYQAQIYANSINLIFTFIKFLKFVRLNERLNVLTRTIEQCQQSIFGVLILFVCVIVCYALAGMQLYGTEMSGYRNLGVSMSTLVQMLVGNMDYEAMRNQNRFLTGAYFWTFVIIALFLLLNMVIAIISDAFGDVSGKAFEQDFDEILVRWWQVTKAQLAPRNICRQIKNFCAGKSELVMLRIVVAELQARLERETASAQERLVLQKEALKSLDDIERAENADVDLRQEQSGGQATNNNDEGSDEEEIEVLMFERHWKEWLEDDTYSVLGAYFFDYTWDDLLNEWDDARKSSEEVDKRRILDTVVQGVEKSVGSELAQVDKLDEALMRLESQTTQLIATLEVVM